MMKNFSKKEIEDIVKLAKKSVPDDEKTKRQKQGLRNTWISTPLDLKLKKNN